MPKKRKMLITSDEMASNKWMVQNASWPMYVNNLHAKIITNNFHTNVHEFQHKTNLINKLIKVIN